MKTLSGTLFLISGFILLITGSIFFMLKAPDLVWVLMISAGFVLMIGSGKEEETNNQGSATEFVK